MINVIIVLLFSLVVSVSNNISAVIAGVSLLENDSGKKIILLHDKHEQYDNNLNQQISLNHQSELQQLIKNVSKCNDKVTFLMEYAYKTINFKGILDNTTIHTAVKESLKNEKHNVQYVSFDERHEIYFWISTMLLNFSSVIEELQVKKNMMPKEFYDVSIQTYIDVLKKDEQKVQELLPQLPIEIQTYAQKKITIYERVQQILKEQMQAIGIQDTDHFMKLAVLKIVHSPQFFNIIIEANTTLSDILLFHRVMSETASDIIVHAGAFHTCQLKELLLVNKYKELFNSTDVQAKNLSSIKWPSTLPASFIKPIYEFLQFCAHCGDGKASSRCGACRKICYCNKECQQEDWKRHKALCKK